MDALAQVTKLLELSRQRTEPVADCRPLRTIDESASRLNVTSFVRSGLNVAVELAVNARVEVKALLTVVVPVASPIETAVASEPIFKVVTPELTRLNVPDVEVMSPPLTATSPVTFTFPPNVVAPVPRKEYVGLVTALPNEMFSEAVVVLILM